LAEDEDSPNGDLWTAERYDPSVSNSGTRWAVLLFLIATIGVIVFRNFDEVLPQTEKYAVLFSLSIVLYILGSVIDGKDKKKHKKRGLFWSSTSKKQRVDQQI
jgi:hypothetical protein